MMTSFHLYKFSTFPRQKIFYLVLIFLIAEAAPVVEKTLQAWREKAWSRSLGTPPPEDPVVSGQLGEVVQASRGSPGQSSLLNPELKYQLL